MSHPIHRVRRVEVVGPYALRVEFDDGTSQTIDLEPVLAGTLYRYACRLRQARRL